MVQLGAVVVAMAGFALFEHFAIRARRRLGGDEHPGVLELRMLTVAWVVGCFVARVSSAVAFGVTTVLVLLSQASMWRATLRTQNSVRGAVLESLGLVSAVAVASAIALISRGG